MILIREWSEKTGSLHEAQAMHLRVYWQVIAPSKKNTVAVDFQNKIIEFKTPGKTKVKRKGIPVFIESVKFIVGNSWGFRLKKGSRYLNVG